jgi:predicted P-loop ATPase
MRDILAEARRLYGLGWAVHWIRPKSKAPVKAKWTTGPRDPWDTVEKDYRKGYGLGVRMGEPSKLKDGYYLANVDVDVKSGEQADLDAALALVAKAFPEIGPHTPCVKTGYGLRYFVKTKAPARSGKVGASSRMAKAFMPTSPAGRSAENAVAEGLLTQAEVGQGWRLRPAWEVEFMSQGRQVVLPPSIHPDTGGAYQWTNGALSAGGLNSGKIPLIETYSLDTMAAAQAPEGTKAGAVSGGGYPDVDLGARGLSPRIVEMIEKGDGVSDRSAALLSATLAMLRAGFSDAEVISVLTDRGNYLGETAYDHRQTENRDAAAAWIRDFTLKKARDTVSADRVFAAEVGVSPTLDLDEAIAQAKELCSMDGGWERQLARSGKDGDGAIKPTLRNVLLVFENVGGADLIKRDLFAGREFFARKAPWVGGEPGKAVDDNDAVNAKAWLAEVWRFEPPTQTIFDAFTTMASNNEFHPVRDELRALPAWDGTARLDTWLKDHFGAEGEDEYLAQVFRKWLVASVKRVFEPGAKFDWLPIFQGVQGTGKSSFASILFGPKYFCDWLPRLDDKDAALGLLGMRCVEFAELDSLRRNELETAKAFITRQVDKVRPPYGRRSIECARQCVFFGTTNQHEFLRDATGNRRFAPVSVGQLDFEQLRTDKDQLWAEALFIYDTGLEETLYLEGDAVEHVHREHHARTVMDESDLMADSLEKFFKAEAAKPAKERFPIDKFKLAWLFQDHAGCFAPLAKWQGSMANMKHAGHALRKLGAVSYKTWKGHFWEMPRK